jgi:hypothetical protein
MVTVFIRNFMLIKINLRYYTSSKSGEGNGTSDGINTGSSDNCYVNNIHIMKLDPEFDNFQFVLFEMTQYVYQNSIDIFENIIITKPNIFIIYFTDLIYINKNMDTDGTLIEFLNYKLMHPHPPLNIKETPPPKGSSKSKSKNKTILPPPPKENELISLEKRYHDYHDILMFKSEYDTLQKIKNEFINKYQFKGKVIYTVLPRGLQ